ncbi:HNH endonuclease [Mycetocola saprophilus]|uniref:HNH endonuclease signature motif containing protein n=1 Tax=Mycetocola saprophilus TaxID=76636 RepID=UPI00068A9F72|nr:HNH endonuclease [Mycetocola saprophilus]
MIGPKTPKPTAADDRRAYAITIKRDTKCVRCGRRGITLDHRQNRQTGNTVPSNLQGLCGTGTTGCHGWKTVNPTLALAEGYAVKRWSDPAQWPGRRLIGGQHTWVLYDDTGDFRVLTAAEAVRKMEGDIRDDDDTDALDAVRGVLAE